MAVIGTSSVNTYQHFEEERNKNQNNAILNVGIGAGVLSGANYLLKTDAGQNVANRVFKLNTTNDYFRFNNFKYQDIKIKKNITLGDIALDFSKTLEEVSPLKILRTFHVSSFISPYTIPNSNLKTVFLTNEQLLLDEDYVRKLISNVSPNTTGDIISELFENGGKVSNGQLLTLDDRLVMENVRLVNLAPSAEGATDATHPFLNRIFEKFRNIHGAKDKNGFVRSALSEKGGIGIIAGKSEKELAINWARSYGRLAVEPGFKLFDRPLDVLAEVIDKTGLPERYGAFEHLRDRLYLGAGAGGDYTQSVPRMFYKMGKNIASLTIAGALAYNYGDKLIREITPEDSPFSKGIIEGLATGYVNARIGIASMWSDNFQDYKAKQEELAPDSTSLLTLAGFPLAGALLGANIGYFTRIKDAATKGIAQADLDATVERSSAVLDSLVGTASYTPKAMNRVGRFAAIGAVLATIPILPFLPGALIGESSEELRAEYSGDKDVEIRSTRFWGSGGMEWEGCLTEDANLIQKNGKTIKATDVKVGDKLLTSSMTFELVVATLKRKVDEDVYSVSTSFNLDGDTKITGNHRLLTYYDSDGFRPRSINREGYTYKSEWVPVCEISKNINTRLFVPFYKPENVVKDIELDLEWAGYHFNEDSGIWCYKFYNKKTLWTEEMIAEIIALSELKPKSKERRYRSIELQEKYNITSTQIKFKLADIRKSHKNGSLIGYKRLSKFSKNKLVFDEKLGLLLGYYAAEGCVADDGRIIFTFHKDEKDYHNNVLSLMKDIFNIDGKIFNSNRSNAVYIIFCDKLISKIIELLIPGKAISKTKAINPVLLDAPIEFCYSFISGVIKGDGSVSSQENSVVIGMTDCQLPRQIQLMLTRLEIFSSLKSHIYNGHKCIRINIPSSSCYKLNKAIDIKYIPKNSIQKPQIQKSFIEIETGFLVSIKKIEIQHYRGDVYDFEMKGLSNFFGTGFLLHNSKIKYYTKSWYAQLMNNAEDIGKYGDQETKDALNPVLNPFDYLRNPYRLEEMNQDESPYPVWGMEVSYGGVFGKLFQATIGAVIKPTIVNERLEEYIESGDIESSGGVELKQQIKESEQSLIDSGMMLAPEAAKLNTKTELAHTAYSALTDFAGLKGWLISLASDELHTGMGDPGLQLSTSGAMNNSARSIIDANLGGMGIAGESIRRFIPTNAGSVLDKANPLRNQSPSWLPHDLDNFYIDFSSGDQFKKVEKGYFRLPGEGYASLNPELKDINPENYPYIQRFKILSDVAIGSDEYYQYKDIMDARYANNQLTEYEQGIYLDTIEKLNKRSVARDFYEEPIADNGMLGNSISKYWKLATSLSETPAESLTFLRPSAKFIHQRTAIEDYEKTQMYGSDSAIWTSPYSDFIKPTINKTLISKEVPEETLDRRAIDEYFDKLEYIKNRRLYKDAISSGDVELAKQYKNKYESTVIGALTTGLDENMEMTRAYISMPDNEKQYFAAFSNMKSEEDRIAVINMQTPEMAEMYSKIWRRKDAMMQNETPESQAAAIMDIVNDESSELISKNKGAYAKYIAGNNSRDSTFEEYLADKRAEEYISNTTGMPNDNFYGWDPRIEIDDIKLKTLTIGKEDVRKYGFWEGDEERLRRMIALDSETQVVNEIEEIKSGIRQEKLQSAIIKSELYHRGITVEEVRFHRSQSNNTNIMVGA